LGEGQGVRAAHQPNNRNMRCIMLDVILLLAMFLASCAIAFFFTPPDPFSHYVVCFLFGAVAVGSYLLGRWSSKRTGERKNEVNTF
jgi:hypothetical protein